MLTGQTALVLETEFIIAMGVQGVLQAMGARQVMMAASTDEAARHMNGRPGFGLAIVEIETKKPDLIEFARQLAHVGVPVIGLSADNVLTKGMPELPGTPILIKPIPDSDLAAAIRVRLAQKP